MVAAITEIQTWWLDELASFVPVRLRRVFEHGRTEVRVAVSEDGLRLHLRNSSGVEDVALIPLEDTTSEQRRSNAQHALAALPRSAASITLALPAAQVLSRPLTFPASARENLRVIVAHEIARRTPFEPGEAYFDIAVDDAAEADGATAVTLYVVPRDTVDDLIAKLDGLGLKPDRVGIAGAKTPAEERLNFLPPPTPSRGQRFEKITAAGLGAIAACLLVAVILVPLQQKRALSVQLTEQVAKARTELAAVSRLERDIAGALDQSRFIASERTRAPAAVVVMDDLTRLLPADTWLFQMHLNDGTVSMQGYTNAVSALVELIESSPKFRNVAVQSNITRDQKTGQERFHVTFDVAGGAI